ncbi:SCO2322 family protein [Kitasatospora kazusensis]|uniref:SCO2322 family protein n=1 Tax=Kitasatospora kazusensis TaxID=407974 RepID=A0ABP5LCA8_9ACTN
MTPAPSRTAATTLAAAVLAALTALLPLLASTPAYATGYRYWSFWKSAGTGWSYQQSGPATYIPPDGGVDGWRFAVSPGGGQNAARPTAAGDFGAICGATAAPPGKKRVAVVLDFGVPADAPSGATPPAPRTACAAVPAAASSAEVLAAVAPPLRYGTDGMLCAIAGYPLTGCGETVSDHPARQSSPTGSGPAVGLAAGAALVVLLGGAAIHQARRRRR